MNQALIEAGKELARVMLLAILPVISQSINPETGVIYIQWNMVAAIALLAGLRFVDKFLHEYGVDSGDESLTKGLTRF